MTSSPKVAPRQAAKLLHVSTDTLRRWAEDGKLTAEKTLGGHRRYDLTELRALAADYRETLR